MIELDGSTSLWVIGLLIFLLGTVIGCILTYTIVARNNRTHQLQFELNELTEDFRGYRDQVTHHFMRTSELVQVMTQSYRSVYEHLASGAQHLCGDNHAAALHNPAAASDTGGLVADQQGEYDDLEELAKIRNDIDELLGESPHIPDMDVKAGKDNPLQH
jgi:uncharacterized membrane-anchored protein YhcB (DUF1043 family)